ncbi:DUF397 domain-containing protein [Actinomadura craniellae]|uniref:DUF397 domain-containing protein n=1 Tax=Actinomadura craniellae TaxID=2231787 RepID=A0A365HAA3_9ACTN|nr:DUF397 domain-containing protein [Actinomadura craniellae]RAY15942.1 DUF397 domain-containing protein [Actinomadura craniellae]
MRDFAAPQWRKSSHSSDEGGECVEVAALSGMTIAIRDSKNPEGSRLLVCHTEFRGLLAQVKAGDLDV